MNSSRRSVWRVFVASFFVVGALVLLGGCKKSAPQPQEPSPSDTVAEETSTSTVEATNEQQKSPEKNSNTVVNTNQQETPQNKPLPEQKKEVVLFQQNNSGVAGTALLTEPAGKVNVAIRLAGALRSSISPASIRTGTCGVPGDTKHVLNNVTSGASVTVLSVSLNELLSYAPLIITVSKSNQEIGTSISCGKIEIN